MSIPTPKPPGPGDAGLGRRSRRVIGALRVPGESGLIDRVVYSTITMMSVLIIYDGWEDLHFVDAAGIIAGPIVAMFIAHTFSAGLARQVAEGRRLHWAERIAIARSESRFLLLAIPPLALLALTRLLGASLDFAIEVVVWAGALSLGYWGYVAGRRAGLTRWPLAGAIIAGLLVGVVILVLQVLLQPGKISFGGEI